MLLTTLSSDMPPKALMTRLVNPLPGDLNTLVGLPAPTINSLAEVVVADPLFAVVPLPVAAELTSSGFAVSNSLYSTFALGYLGLGLNFTDTVVFLSFCLLPTTEEQAQ